MLTLNHSFPELRCKVSSVYFLNPQCYSVDRQITTWTESFCMLIQLVKILGRLTVPLAPENASFLTVYASEQLRELSETLLYLLSLLHAFLCFLFYRGRLLPLSVVLPPYLCSSGSSPMRMMPWQCGEMWGVLGLSLQKEHSSRLRWTQGSQSSPVSNCSWLSVWPCFS